MEEYVEEEEGESNAQEEGEKQADEPENSKRTGKEAKRPRKDDAEPEFPARTPPKVEERPGNLTFAEIF